MTKASNLPPANLPQNIFSHLQELGKRMKVVIFTFFVSTVVFMVAPGTLEFFSNPMGAYEPLVAVILRNLRTWTLPSEVTLIGLGFSDPIELYFQVAIVFAMTITIPVVAFEVFRFVDPALRPQEKKHVYPFLSSVLVLFVAGAVFGFLVLFPVFIQSMMPFFATVGAEPYIAAADFYGMFMFTTLAAGLMFTFPAWVVLLVKIGILKTQLLTKNRKWLYLIIFIATMLITPGNAPQENFAFFLPLLLLFEGGILVSKRIENKRKKALADL